MKIITFLILIVISPLSYTQLPYFWVNGVNPGWISSNPTNRTLGWQSCALMVSSSNCNNSGGWFPYNNSQITSYTSGIVNTMCSNASTVVVTINLDVFLENRYDWLYFQYSLNGGATWINPVELSSSTNGSGVNLSAYPPLTTYSTDNSNRNGWTNSMLGNRVYVIPESSTTMFRFIFVTDGSVNTYNFGSNIYYADIKSFSVNCLSVLPVSLISFTGENVNERNVLNWITESEYNNDYFTIESSIDGVYFEKIGTVKALNAGTMYEFVDETYQDTVNYYRLSQTDFNGEPRVIGDLVVIDNRSTKVLIGVFDLSGRKVDVNFSGVKVLLFSDGSREVIGGE